MRRRGATAEVLRASSGRRPRAAGLSPPADGTDAHPMGTQWSVFMPAVRIVCGAWVRQERDGRVWGAWRVGGGV
jgi:hypothetical protein